VRVGERFVVLGLSLPRSPWFGAVSQWAHAGVVPVEFIKCVSSEELRARLASARPHSAILIDAGLPALDRDLVDGARRAHCAVIVIGESARTAVLHQGGLSLDGILAPGFSPTELSDALGAAARMITRADVLPNVLHDNRSSTGRSAVIAVCGPGGTGVSTVGMALAQGLAGGGASTLLADLALRSELGALHHAPDVGPGVQELVDANRSAVAGAEEIRKLTWLVEERGYHLLLGLRRRKAWASLRPRSFEMGFDGLRRAFDAVVCDTDADVEGEAEGGSLDVEERHLMARTAIRQADIVVVVGEPGVKGVHSLLVTLTELATFGVPPARFLIVVNQAPRAPRGRAEIAQALAGLAGPAVLEGAAGPIFIPRRAVDEAVRDGARLPAAVVDPLVGAYRAMTARVGMGSVGPAHPAAVTPGSLGAWADTANEQAGHSDWGAA
jgi:MinD-like ATPase involved in chromosome partitioning or flagellar assembly